MNYAAEPIELETRNLTAAIDVLLQHFRPDATIPGNVRQDTSTSHIPMLSATGPEIHEAKRRILASMRKLHSLLHEPAEFMQNLIIQSQVLSCLTWLAEFQVLAYIPLTESVPMTDIAELSGLPASQLSRMVRMTATAGFMCEPQPGHVAHTALSAAIVQRLTYLDTVLFLGKVSAPACLRMAETTKRGGDSENSHGARANTMNQIQDSPTILSLQNHRLQRSWSTFLQCLGDVDDSIDEVLIRLDWHILGKATIVDPANGGKLSGALIHWTTDPRNLALTDIRMLPHQSKICSRSVSDVAVLVNRFPALKFIVQLANATTTGKSSLSPLESSAGAIDPCDSSERVTIQERTPGSPQTITDAAVYLLRVPSPSTGGSVFNDRESLRRYIHSELTAHFDVLRTNPAVKFVLSFRPLPEAKCVDPHIEAMARARDLAKMALTNGGDLELREVLDIVEGVHDDQGRLAVINKIQCQNSATVVLSIRYQR